MGSGGGMPPAREGARVLVVTGIEPPAARAMPNPQKTQCDRGSDQQSYEPRRV